MEIKVESEAEEWDRANWGSEIFEKIRIIIILQNNNA